MDGTTFVKKLKALNIPGAEKLRANDFDWVFQQDCSQDLSLFWKIFFENYRAEDLLSDDEIKEYADLKSKGLVLSGDYIKKINSFVVPSVVENDVPSPLDLRADDLSETETEELKQKLSKLDNRQKFLSIQQLEIQARINEKREDMKNLKLKVETKKRVAAALCEEYSNIHEDTKLEINDVSSFFHDFGLNKENCLFVSQLSCQEWWAEEDRFKDAVETYIEAHFGEKSNTNYQNGNISCLPTSYNTGDSSELFSIADAEHKSNTSELARVTRMLEDAELDAIDIELSKSEKDAEIRSAIEFMKRIKADQALTLPLIKEELQSLQRMSLALEQDLEFEKKYLKKQALFVAQTDRFRTLLVDYETRLLKQRQFLSKYNQLKDYLLNQLVRLDFMKIIYDSEKTKINQIKDLLNHMKESLSREFDSTSARIKHLTELRERHLNGDIYAQKRDIIKRIIKGTSKERNSIQEKSDVESLLDDLESSLRNSDQELSVAVQTQVDNVTKLYSSCLVLEKCLFGAPNKLRPLPASWLNSEVVDREKATNKCLSDFQQRMLKVLSDYDKKKKVLQDNPIMKDEMLKWTQ